MSAAEFRVEVEYRLVIGGKKVSLSRGELETLRDRLSAVLAGQAVPEAPMRESATGWTAEEDETLIALIQRGKPFSVVAHQLGRTEGAVWRRHLKLQHALNGNGVSA